MGDIMNSIRPESEHLRDREYFTRWLMGVECFLAERDLRYDERFKAQRSHRAFHL